MKKILVPIKRVPDYQLKIAIASDGKSIDPNITQWIVNPFDEIAVEEAVRIKEKSSEEIEIILACIGPEAASEQILKALAIGADLAVHVISDTNLDSSVISQILAELVKSKEANLVIMGKQAIDSDAGQVGAMLAERLSFSQATFASELNINSSWESAQVTREVDGGLETIEISLPAVVTTDLRLNEPRYASLPGIVKAKKKPVEKLDASSFSLNLESPLEIVNLEYPKKRSAGVIVETVDDLVDKLVNEAKVIGN